MREIPVDVKRCILGADYIISTQARSGITFVGINLMASETSLEVVAQKGRRLFYSEIIIDELLRFADEAEKAGFQRSNS